MEITLRKWTLEDKEALMYICNSVKRDYLSERLPYPYTKENALWWLNMVNEDEGREGIFRAILVDDKIIGNISIEKKSDVYKKNAEIGYMLLDEYKSRGIMSEAVKQICIIAFNELDIIRITGLVYKPNVASQRVLEKNDFIQEGLLKNAVYKNNQVYDLCVYGKVK